MPGSASAIPPEILFRILDFVESKSTLINWTLCSSQFYETGVPYLYRHIELYDDEDGQALYGFPHLRSLASLLLRRPDLARLVRHFTMREAFNDGNTPRQCNCGQCPIVEDLEDHEIVEVDEVFQAAIEASSCSGGRRKAVAETHQLEGPRRRTNGSSTPRVDQIGEIGSSVVL